MSDGSEDAADLNSLHDGNLDASEDREVGVV